SNIPGGREKATTWVDAAGNLWLFGGYGTGAGSSSVGWLDDLWKYDIATGMWTWMHGSKDTNNFTNYGNMGQSNEFVRPGGREDAMAWADNSGNLWLFGGYGYAGPSA